MISSNCHLLFSSRAGNDLKGGVQDNVSQLSEQGKAFQDQGKALLDQGKALQEGGKALQEQGKALQEGAGQLKQEGLEARDALKEGAGQIVQEGKQVGQEIKGNVMTGIGQKGKQFSKKIKKISMEI